MQPGFSNGQRYWMSPEGNAIWYVNDEDEGSIFVIGDSEYLGTATVSLYAPIKDPSVQCPHDDLQSNWWYDPGGDGWAEDVNNSVLVQCVTP